MLKPILDRVLVKRIEQAPAVQSLIEIPDQYKQSSKVCKVVALGDFVVLGGQSFPLSQFLSVGDTVLISDYGDEQVMVDGEELILVRIQDIRGRDIRVPSDIDPAGEHVAH